MGDSDENGGESYESASIAYLMQMSDEELQRRLLRTPGKRRRRVSDVIDSSPASNSSGQSYAPAGLVTPQRGTTRTDHWTSAISPDQGYSATPDRSTPDRARMYTPDWYQRINSHDASMTGTSEETYKFTRVDLSGRMPTHKDADRYNMGHRSRGKCVIFNHENFDTGFETREGSSADARRIEQTFQRLGFVIELCEDYDYGSVKKKITELSEEDHTDNDCLCIFVLTHGLKNDLIFAKDVVYKLDSIWKPFTADKCRTLAGKPKLFFFQACRGDNLDGGIRMQRNLATETDSLTDFTYKIPTHADFLFAHSTVQGFYSWRNPEEGTWYVQSLCDVINEHSATMDLVKMLTMTARKVATDFASFNNVDPSLHDLKQVPSITSMLIRDLFFTPKNA